MSEYKFKELSLDGLYSIGRILYNNIKIDKEMSYIALLSSSVNDDKLFIINNSFSGKYKNFNSDSVSIGFMDSENILNEVIEILSKNNVSEALLKDNKNNRIYLIERY